MAAGTIQHLLDSQRLHLSKAGRPVRICLNSLLKEVGRAKEFESSP
jgi:hypothetical protein